MINYREQEERGGDDRSRSKTSMDESFYICDCCTR